MDGKPKVMLLIDPGREYERSLLRGISRFSQLHGPWIFQREMPFWEVRQRRALLAQLEQVDGIIMRERTGMAEIVALGKPTIVSSYLQERPPASAWIVSDHAAMGRLAAEHLLERGFSHFAFCGYASFFWSRQRCEGFQARLAQAGHAASVYRRPRLSRPDQWRAEQQVMADWLISLPKPVAIMTCVDELSQQVVEICKAINLAIPDQVAVIGVDNDEFICALSALQLSSIAIGAEPAGFTAAAMLSALMAGRSVGERTILVQPQCVVTRASTDTLAVADPHLAQAGRFIQEHCQHPLPVEAVARAAGLSRRVLEKRFRTCLRRTIGQEIRRQRTDLIERMLVDTDLPVADIAASLGFQDPAHIARYFRIRHAMSPLSFRKRHRDV